jgi:hypothetical protein
MAKNSSLVEAGIGDEFFLKIFGENRFVPCIVEIVKNSRDCGAQNVMIACEQKDRIVVIDDGEGMGPENQSAFISVDRSTRRGSAMFGTGAKSFIFSQTKSFVIRTVFAERPREVCIIECTIEELNRILRTAGSLNATYQPKTSKNWPYQANTGTEITFMFNDPKRTAILRGQELAEALSARLPMKFGNILRVDGKVIPEKVVIGDVFHETIEDPNLGEVTFEVYRPESRKSADDALLLGSGELGEVPIVDFKLSIHPLLRDRIPSTYLLRNDVCGFISVPFLRAYAKEDRKSVSARIADEPKVAKLIDLLRRVEPRIKKCLKLESGSNEPNYEGTVQDIACLLRYVYGQTLVEKKSVLPDQGIVEEADREGTVSSRAPFMLRLTKRRREYAVGETIDVILEVDSKFADNHDLAKLRWSVTDEILTDLKVAGRGAVLRAGKVGSGKIIVDLPDTPHSAMVNVTVVKDRKIRFAKQREVVTQGDVLTLKLRNTDVLKGDRVLLHASGRNPVAQTDALDSVTFRADIVETAIVTAVDSKDARHTASCEIEVLPRTVEVLLIRNNKFLISSLSGISSERQSTVSIIPGDDTHQMYINLSNEHAVTASQKGDLRTFLILAIGHAVAKFITTLNFSSRQFSSLGLMEQVEELGLEIATEILTGKPVK